MSSNRYNHTTLNSGYSNRGAIAQQNSRIISQHYRHQGFEMETITKFMKSSKAMEKSAESSEVAVKVEDALQDDFGLIRSEVLKEIERQKPYSCIIENTLCKMKYEPLKQILTDLLALIEKEEDRIKQQLYKPQKSTIRKRKSQRQLTHRRATNQKSALLIPDQPHQATPFREQWSQRKDHSHADYGRSLEQQRQGKLSNPEQLRVQSRMKEYGQLTIQCQDRVSQKRLKSLLNYIKEAQKKRDQLNVEITNLEQLYGIKKAGYLKSREDNEREKQNYASKISESNERNRLEEEQKQRFLQNLQLAQEQYNNRRKEITNINQQIQELHHEEEMLKQRKSKLIEQVEELNAIIERLDKRIDNMNKQLSKLHAQYGRQSAQRKVRERFEKAEKVSNGVRKPLFFQLKSTSGLQAIQTNVSALFSGQILGSQQDYQSYLIQLLMSFQGKSIEKTKLLYRYDPTNQENLHIYVDDKPNVLLIIQTEENVFLAFYSRQPFCSTCTPTPSGALIISLSDMKQYELHPNRQPIIYDDTFLIFGNNEARISSASKTFSSQFGQSSGYFNPKGDTINNLLKKGNERESVMKNYQIHQVFFRND